MVDFGAGIRRPAGLAFRLLATVLFVSGCTTSLGEWWHNGFKVGPQYCRPNAPFAENWLDSGDTRLKTEPAQDCAWWTVFNDSVLNGLIEAAYQQNLDLKAAGSRILESRAQRNIAIGNLFPQSQTALADYAHAQLTKNIGLPLPSSTLNVWADGFNMSWEVDFWGRYRRTIEGAEADLDASVESYGDTLVMLLSEVATSYVQLRTYEERLQFARQNVTVQKRSLQLAETRFRNGRGTELDVRQARSSLSQTESLIPPLITGRRQAANQLCTLLGVPVANLADELSPAGIPKPPMEVAVGIPADLLRRRPDVRRAERQVAAQMRGLALRKRTSIPGLSINGFVGFVADDFKDLFTSKSFTGLFFPTLQWNVLNYGRIHNNIKTQDATSRDGDVPVSADGSQRGSRSRKRLDSLFAGARAGEVPRRQRSRRPAFRRPGPAAVRGRSRRFQPCLHHADDPADRPGPVSHDTRQYRPAIDSGLQGARRRLALLLGRMRHAAFREHERVADATCRRCGSGSEPRSRSAPAPVRPRSPRPGRRTGTHATGP